MTHILIGENSSGKTKTLYDKIQGLPMQRVVTNLEEYQIILIKREYICG